MPTLLLVIDDDPMILQLARTHLANAGYDVMVAEDGESGMQIVRECSPSIVITDWEMPGLDGLEVCRRVRGLDDFDWIYTLVLTAHDDVDNVVRAFDAGADDFLRKPVDKGELLARVRAGERIVRLQNDLAKRELEISRRNAELEIAYQKLSRANRRLDEMATTDDLTGLSNRRAAMTELDQRWTELQRTGTPMSVVLIDIDHFKGINDRFGHDVGDIVLVEVARALRGTTRASEQVFRFGGEEFVLVCANATAAMAEVAAERLRSTVEQVAIENPGAAPIEVTVSLGVAEHQLGMGSVTDVIKAADEALYEAKRSGRNRVCVAPSPASAAPGSETPSGGGSTAALRSDETRRSSIVDAAEITPAIDDGAGDPGTYRRGA